MLRTSFLGIFASVIPLFGFAFSASKPLTIDQKQDVLKYALCKFNSLEVNEEYSICHAGPYLGLHKEEGMYSIYLKFDGKTENFSNYDMFMDGKYSIMEVKVK